MERPADNLDAVARLAEAFKARHMGSHLSHLRAYWGARQGGHTSVWDADFVEHWMAVLRLAPFEDRYPVRPPNSNCTVCLPTQAAVWVAVVYPGGWLTKCKCGRAWLSLELTSEERHAG